MQNQHLEIKEIIYEICQKCNNGCSYCGSKEGWTKEIDEERIIKIAEAITDYSGTIKAIDISGGDPLLVSYSTHRKITDIFKFKKISPKILLNPKSLEKSDLNEVYKIIGLYDWVGVSINEKEELAINLPSWLLLKTTVISNFNLSNVFLFDQIKEIVKRNKLAWQIQYTMYTDSKDKMALCNNEEANNYLMIKINEAIDDGVVVIPADNMNNGACGAGNCSLGLLANGDVVPCLSMRSWDNNIEIMGNVLIEGLDTIWREGFQTQRFNNFKCCKDHCGNKCFIRTVKALEEKPIEDGYVLELDKASTDWCKNNRKNLEDKKWEELGGIYTYAVVPNPYSTVQLYAVSTPSTIPEKYDRPVVAVYSVFKTDKVFSTNNPFETFSANNNEVKH